MIFIQTDVSTEALVTAIRANMCDLFRHLARKFPGGYLEHERFARWHTPVEHPWFNGVLSSRPPEEQDEAFVESSIRYFREQGIGVFTWWMDASVPCSDWEPVLSKQGFGFSNDTPGMALDLQELHEPVRRVDGLEIRTVTDEETLRNWARVFTPGYGLPPAWEPSIIAWLSSMGLDLPVRNYIGLLNGEPVATSSLFLGGGAAGIYSVSTLPNARGKGIGAALTLHPLQEAQEMGYRIGVLQSSEMGYNIYKNLGFQHLCQIENFHLVLT